jgi:ferredoxin
MKNCKVYLNDDLKTFPEGANLYGVLNSADGMKALCYHPQLQSKSNCDLCFVEVQYPFEDRRRLRRSCSVEVQDNLKVWTRTEQLSKLRASEISLLISNFSPLLLSRSKKLRDTLASLTRSIASTVALPSTSDAGPGKLKSLTKTLKFNSSQCIACGLCEGINKDSKESHGLKLVLNDKTRSVDLETPLDFDESLALSLSLHCPTGALVSSNRPLIRTPFALPEEWIVTLPSGEEVCCIYRQGELALVPSEKSPLLTQGVYDLLKRYDYDSAVYKASISSTVSATEGLTWIVGRSLDGESRALLKQLVLRLRHRVEMLDESGPLVVKGHHLAPRRDQTKAIVLLGPEDSLELSGASVHGLPLAGIFLARYDQVSGLDLRDRQVFSILPFKDVFEFEQNKKFSRHLEHGLREIGL